MSIIVSFKENRIDQIISVRKYLPSKGIKENRINVDLLALQKQFSATVVIHQ